MRLHPRLLVFGLVLAACCLATTTARAAQDVQFGVTDDAWLAHGPGTLGSRLAELDRVGVDIVRYTLRWDDIAVREPANARNPRDRAYHWGTADAVLEGLDRRGIAALVTLVGTPDWANNGSGSNWVPEQGASFADFAYAAALRYPFVHHWTIWNEPNQQLWLRPTSASVYVKKLLNPAYVAIKQASPESLVAGGVTAPRGNGGGVSPLAWIQGMGKAGAKLDAYAHHPYPLLPKTETPFTGGCAHCQTVTMATLEKLITAVGRWLGPKRIWLTEYGYQTNPPDLYLGVSLALQAQYLAEASLRAWKLPHVDMLINFLFRDDVDGDSGIRAGWQSGLVSASGKAKPSLVAFTLPFVQVSRSGGWTRVWGQVRPRSGHQPYRLLEWRNGSWQWLGPAAQTGPTGIFVRRLRVGKGARIRIWSPRDRAYSLVLAVR
jgi:hypothetical protein